MFARGLWAFTERVTRPARVKQIKPFNPLVKIVTRSVKPAPTIHPAPPRELRFVSAF